MNGLSRVLHVQFGKEKGEADPIPVKGATAERTLLWDSRAMRAGTRFEAWAQLCLGAASLLAIGICLKTTDYFCRDLARVGASFQSDSSYVATGRSNETNAALSCDVDHAKTNVGAHKNKS